MQTNSSLHYDARATYNMFGKFVLDAFKDDQTTAFENGFASYQRKVTREFRDRYGQWVDNGYNESRR